MVIIVTGGAGFIGSNFIEYIFHTIPDCKVVCLDKMTYAGNPNAITALSTNSMFQFEKGDICSRETVFSLLDRVRPDYVVHFAAESHVDRSITNPRAFLQTNIIGTSVLMDACLKYNIKRFHLVSTDEVYGDLPLDDSTIGFTEESPLKPNSPYSCSKAAADMLAMAYRRTYGLNVTISRCSNNYGPFQHLEKLIPKMINNALKGLPLPIYGDGLNVRDWIHVYDHCEAIFRILFQGQAGAIYNVASENLFCNLDVVNEICSLTNTSRDHISFVDDRKGHDLKYALDSSKIRKELGWVPKVPFNEGLKSTIQWYENHPNWWAKA